MPLPAVIENERENLSEHPAARAWSKLSPAGACPLAIEMLKHKPKSVIHRLVGVGPNGSAVIAKRCWLAAAQFERVIYTEILPRLPMPALRFFGFLEDEDSRYGWLFIEDAGKGSYSPASREHRAALARWLAALHVSAAELETASQLPERGAGFYRDQLRLARDGIVAHLDHPALKNGELALLKEILVACAFLDARWDRLEEFCRTMPPTFVHGDLKEKNICVRRADAGLIALPFDWEIAGWGNPATDLLRCPDFAAYGLEARKRWPELKLENLKTLATVGMIFRMLIGIYWKSLALQYECVEWPVNKLGFYRDRLAEGIQALEIK